MRACILQLNTESIHYIYYIKKRPFSRNKIMLHNFLHFFQTQRIHHCNNRSVMICNNVRYTCVSIRIAYLYLTFIIFLVFIAANILWVPENAKELKLYYRNVIHYKIKRFLRFPVATVSFNDEKLVVVVFTRSSVRTIPIYRPIMSVNPADVIGR